MKGNRPSRTARMVVFGRALADVGVSHVADFHDPTARVFLGKRWKQRLAQIERDARSGARSVRLESSRVAADIMALRTSAIDAAVRDAIAAGATQLVILGAGYDGRAWRLSELANVRVFEVDHPATQRDKRAHLSELPAPIGSVSFVTVDFERESIGPALARAGHDASSPTCWIWEGVVMYLTREAMRATLAAVAARSAPGSTLIVNYHAVRRGGFARFILRVLGEPQISAWTPGEMAADLSAAGFAMHDDAGITDWNARFAGGQAKVDRVFFMRVAVARR